MVVKKKNVFLITAAILTAAVAFLLIVALQKPETPKSDFSELSWTDAFKKLNERMSKEYAFTEWKGIDWQELYDAYLPKIESAQLKKDYEAYYITLLNFLNEIPDGHVQMSHLPTFDYKYIGGGFGFAVTKLDDGRIIVSWVDEFGPAWKAGIRAGAELIEWNGRPVMDAAAAVSTAFAGTSATKENLECKKLQYLVRAPIGTQANLILKSRETAKQQSVSLTAYDDKGQSLKKNYPDSVISADTTPDSIVEKKIINGNIFYIKLWAELDADLKHTGQTQSTLELLRQAVQEANDQKCSGLILDVRNNIGGFDSMAADILGSFYSEKIFYEYQEFYNYATGKHEIQPEDYLYIEPVQQRFDGPIIALINTKCVSSGEGIALGIQNLPNGETLGFYGTNGSFGMTGAEAIMPGGLTVNWPYGQSRDENKNTQMDSRDGIGGVSPTIRIPMSEENAIRAANGVDVELEEAIRSLSSPANNS